MSFRKGSLMRLAPLAVIAVHFFLVSPSNGQLIGSSTARRIVKGPTPPVTCSPGDVWFDTNAAEGAQALVCGPGANHWGPMSTGGGGGGAAGASWLTDFDATTVTVGANVAASTPLTCDLDGVNTQHTAAVTTTAITGTGSFWIYKTTCSGDIVVAVETGVSLTAGSGYTVVTSATGFAANVGRIAEGEVTSDVIGSVTSYQAAPHLSIKTKPIAGDGITDTAGTWSVSAGAVTDQGVVGGPPLWPFGMASESASTTGAMNGAVGGGTAVRYFSFSTHAPYTYSGYAFNISTVDSDAGADQGIAFAIVDTSCAVVSGTAANLNSASLTSGTVKFATTAADVTLPVGNYALAYTTDSATIRVTVFGDSTQVTPIANAVGTNPPFYLGTNGSTGTGATLAVPAACGGRTALGTGTNLGQPPMVALIRD